MCALMGTAKLIHRFAEKRIAEHNLSGKLSGARMGVLFAVEKAGMVRMGDLAAKLNVAARTVTDLIDGMERDGLVQRLPDPNDRRAMLLELTAAAKAKFEVICALRERFTGEIFNAIDPHERDQLIQILSKIKDRLKSIVSDLPLCDDDEQ